MNRFFLIQIFLLLSVGIYSQNWLSDINEAKKLAMNEHKPIILVFQGSDWCAPCMKLEKEIWSTEQFKKYAAEHYVLLKADFPKRKQNALSKEQQDKNNLLAETYNKQGFFPYVVILNSDARVIGSTGYKDMSCQDYINHLNSIIKEKP